jgi:trypsin
MTANIIKSFVAFQEGGTASTTVRQVTAQITSDSSCSSSYPGKITARMICAGTASGGKDSCQVTGP